MPTDTTPTPLAKAVAAAAEHALAHDREHFSAPHGLSLRLIEIADHLPGAIAASDGQLRADLESLEALVFGAPPAYPVKG